MDKAEFISIVETHILPLFTGSFLAGEIESSPRDMEVALGKSNSVLLKPNKLENYRIILKRGQAFKNFELDLLCSILFEINSIACFNISDKLFF